MTLEKIAWLISPLDSDISVVRGWLEANGITSVETVITKDYLILEAPVRVVEKMFQVSMRYFVNKNHNNDSPILRSTVPYSIPKDLSSIIDIVFGLTNFPSSRPTVRVSQSRANQNLNVTPPVIKETMRIFNTTGSSRQDNIHSVIQFLNEYHNPDDIAAFIKLYNLPTPNVKVIGVNKVNVPPSIEATLDLEYIVGTATGVETWVYEIEGKNSGNLFLKWLLQMNNQTQAPTVCSVSYDEPEDELHDGYVTKTHVEFIKAGVRGISILFASGDQGTGCATQCAQFVVNWPASSPYVTSVGGVVLHSKKPYQVTGDSISGGGFSTKFKAPKYKERAIAHYLKNVSFLPPAQYYNLTFNGRAVPDIASYSQNVMINWLGVHIPVGGTSAATPITAGLLSLINEALLAKGKPTLGFFNPLLYKLALTHPQALFDVTQGINTYGCCPLGFGCANGWDPVTGWGVPMYDGLLDAILQYHNINN